jgi:Rrf2 family nitric oxide-sensitive transcriptional repressor
MYLTLHSDYAMRVLMYLATHEGQPVRTVDVSQAYNISRNHLVRVVQTLARNGFLKVTAGRTGGIKLSRPAAEINLGQVFRATEPCFNLVECFSEATNTCPIAAVCGVKPVLKEASDAFLGVLAKYTLADACHCGAAAFLPHFLQPAKQTYASVPSPMDTMQQRVAAY